MLASGGGVGAKGTGVSAKTRRVEISIYESNKVILHTVFIVLKVFAE